MALWDVAAATSDAAAAGEEPFLLRRLHTKYTALHAARFSRANLVLAAGPYAPPAILGTADFDLAMHADLNADSPARCASTACGQWLCEKNLMLKIYSLTPQALEPQSGSCP